MANVVVDGSSLKLEELVNVARLRFPVKLSREAVKRLETSRSVLEGLARNGKTIYGVTTGFGALGNTRITLEQAAQLQTNLVGSRACGVGENLSLA